jgi:hypothetical protein
MLINLLKYVGLVPLAVNGALVLPTSARAVLTFLVIKPNTTFFRVETYVLTVLALRQADPNNTVFFDVTNL